MVMLLFSEADVPERDTEVIVNYLSDFTNIPNTVTSVILGTRLFDTIGGDCFYDCRLRRQNSSS